MAVWSQATLSGITVFDRCDGEYFLPAYIENEKELAQVETTPLPQMFFVSDGNHLSVSNHFSDDGDIPYFRGQDINDFFLENAFPIMIPEKVFSSPMMARSHFFAGDVLLSIVGTIGSLSIVPESLGSATGSCKIAILRSKGVYSPFVLAAFLLSRFGQLQIRRNTRGAVQMGLILKDLVRVHVPMFEEAVASQIEHFVKLAIEANTQSKTAYTQAQQLLESELGLDKLRFDKPVGYTARFSELESSLRFDPEHFYPTFKELCAGLPETVSLEPLYRFVQPLKTGIQPTYLAGGEYEVINSKHIGVNKIDTSKLRHAAPASYSVMADNGDVLLNATGRGTLGRCAVLETDIPRIFDVCIIRIRPVGIDPYFLSALLNTRFGQLQMELHTRGTSGQLHLYPRDARKILIWPAPESLQAEVRELMTKAARSAQEATRLLEQAKFRVEQLIEEAVQA